MRAPLLRRIAEETGGRFYTPATAARLAEDITYMGRGVTVAQQKELWDMPIVLAALLGLLAAEWLLRRRWGSREEVGASRAPGPAGAARRCPGQLRAHRRRSGRRRGQRGGVPPVGRELADGARDRLKLPAEHVIYLGEDPTAIRAYLRPFDA